MKNKSVVCVLCNYIETLRMWWQAVMAPPGQPGLSRETLTCGGKKREKERKSKRMAKQGGPASHSSPELEVTGQAFKVTPVTC